MALHFEVVTLFPELVRQALRFGVVGRAVERGLAVVGTVDPRDFTVDVHRTVDDRPYGGGPGMVMKPEPLWAAIGAARARAPAGVPVVYLSAQGRTFDQRVAQRLAASAGAVLLALALSLHPYSYMIRPGNFPEACPFSVAELAEWRKLWSGIFAMAKERGIETYLLNWNIFVSPEFARAHDVAPWSVSLSHIGKESATNNLVVRYTREV